MARICVACGMQVIDGALAVKVHETCSASTGIRCVTDGIELAVPVLARTLPETLTLNMQVLTGGLTGAVLEASNFITDEDTGSSNGVWRILGDGTVEILCDGIFVINFVGGADKGTADRQQGLRVRVQKNGVTLTSSDIHEIGTADSDFSSSGDGMENHVGAGPLSLVGGDVINYTTTMFGQPSGGDPDFKAQVNRFWIGRLGERV